MPDVFFIVVVAILAVAFALSAFVLWRWAARRQARNAAGRFLAQQIAMHGTGGGIGSTESAGSEAPSTDKKAGPATLEVPDRLKGVVTLRTSALCAAAMATAGLAVLATAGALAAAAAFVLLALLATFALWLRVQKRRRRMVMQLPGFIDGMVRLLAVGNAMQTAFQLAAVSAKEPLRQPLEDAASRARAGVDLELALQQVARTTGMEELSLLASILGLGVRYGGRTDQLLERVADFIRDREQAEQELIAMSAETRLSAWILGMLPMIVAGLIVLTNAPYFMGMWLDPTGQKMIFAAVALQASGALLLYRLARIR